MSLDIKAIEFKLRIDRVWQPIAYEEGMTLCADVPIEFSWDGGVWVYAQIPLDVTYAPPGKGPHPCVRVLNCTPYETGTLKIRTLAHRQTLKIAGNPYRSGPLPIGKYQITATVDCNILQGNDAVGLRLTTDSGTRLWANTPFDIAVTSNADHYIAVCALPLGPTRVNVQGGELFIVPHAAALQDARPAEMLLDLLVRPKAKVGKYRPPDAQRNDEAGALASALGRLLHAANGLSPHHIPSQAELRDLREAIYIAQKVLRSGEPR